MMRRSWLFLLVCMMLLTACSPAAPVEAPATQVVSATSQALPSPTLPASLSATAEPSIVASSPAVLSTADIPPAATSIAAVETVASPTSPATPEKPLTTVVVTAVPASETPIQPPPSNLTSTQTLATPGVSGCTNQAEFVRHLTVSDGAILLTNQAIGKMWRVRNVGTCTWDTSYTLVWVDGQAWQSAPSISLAQSVTPGQEIDLNIPLLTPLTPGSYQGGWMLATAAGEKFGVGSNYQQPLALHVQVRARGPEEKKFRKTPGQPHEDCG